MRNRTKDGVIIFILCIFICMGIGYAALSENLKLIGTATILGDSNWKIHFVQAACSPINKDRLVYPDSSKIVFKDSKSLEAEFSAKLVPGEIAEYHIQIINDGTIPGMYVDNVITADSGNPVFGGSNTPCVTCNVVPVTNQVTQPIFARSIDHEFYVRLVCDSNITDLPDSDVIAKFRIVFNYEQSI